MRSIDPTHLIREATGRSLAEAKRCVDDILEDRPVELRFETEQAACSFVHDAESLGADCSSDDRSTCARADEPEPEDAG